MAARYILRWAKIFNICLAAVFISGLAAGCGLKFRENEVLEMRYFGPREETDEVQADKGMEAKPPLPADPSLPPGISDDPALEMVK